MVVGVLVVVLVIEMMERGRCSMGAEGKGERGEFTVSFCSVRFFFFCTCTVHLTRIELE